MFYAILFRSQLVRRWLSGWGLVANISDAAAGLLVMFGMLDPSSSVAGALNLPLALQKMVLAVWLIVKGFNPPRLALTCSSYAPRDTQDAGAFPIKPARWDRLGGWQ